MEYFSQYGQDKIINELLKDKDKGFYVDVGAHDGITFSNSKFFEDKGWDGICIEPLPEVFKKLKENRNCIKEKCAISNKEGIFDFIYISDYGEMLSGFNREEVAKTTIKRHGGESKCIKVDTFRLKTILEKHNITYIDFCSIDVENHELDVVKSLDFSEIIIKYLIIEANKDIEHVTNYLKPWYNKIKSVGGDFLYERIEEKNN